MRPPVRAAILLTAGLFFLTAPLACGAAFPVLKAPILYAGEYKQGNEPFLLFLHLGEGQEFAMRAKPARHDAQESGWEETGIWYQIRDGAFLQLTSVSGFHRLINVGGRGDLYLGMAMPERAPLSITLRPKNLSHEYPRGSPPAAKDNPALYTPGYFLDAVAEKRWKITWIGSADGKTPPDIYRLTFLAGKERDGGGLEIFDGARHVVGKYALHGGLTLEAKVGDERLAWLVRGTRSWRLVGEVLELRDTNGVLALLERIR
jgi:hypothetical protein